jgi:hypothetical protein
LDVQLAGGSSSPNSMAIPAEGAVPFMIWLRFSNALGDRVPPLHVQLGGGSSSPSSMAIPAKGAVPFMIWLRFSNALGDRAQP